MNQTAKAIDRELQRTSYLTYNELTKKEQDEILRLVDENHGDVYEAVRRWQLS